MGWDEEQLFAHTPAFYVGLLRGRREKAKPTGPVHKEFYDEELERFW